MFCPKCATQHVDGASFCRTCGANISLIPQALSGQLPQVTTDAVVEEGCTRKQRKRLTLEHAFKNIFLGMAFLLISLALSRSGPGQGWWFWMLIPAFTIMGTGVAQYIRLRESNKQASFAGPATQRNSPVQSAPAPASLPRRQTGELISPVASVTEGTTRHLGVEAPTRHLDASERR